MFQKFLHFETFRARINGSIAVLGLASRFISRTARETLNDIISREGVRSYGCSGKKTREQDAVLRTAAGIKRTRSEHYR